VLEYAVLRSHSGLPSLRGCLYYSQRLVIQPAIRRAAARIIAAGINMLEQRPEPFAVAAGAEALRQMQTDGYAMLPDMLRPKQIDEILAYLGDKPLLMREGRCLGPAEARSQATVADLPLDVVLQCPHVLAAANNAFLIQLAIDYLGCMPTISTIGMRWSFPGGEPSIQTQHFHRDPDDWRFFKLFIYLSDVDAESGPHLYVKGTHCHAGTLRARRFERAELERRYGREAIVALTGPRGTSFIADTYGIHAGPVPLSRPRLMLEIGYSILPVYSLSYRPRRIAQAHGLNRYVNRLLVR
jgi:hypothetical protein